MELSDAALKKMKKCAAIFDGFPIFKRGVWFDGDKVSRKSPD